MEKRIAVPLLVVLLSLTPFIGAQFSAQGAGLNKNRENTNHYCRNHSNRWLGHVMMPAGIIIVAIIAIVGWGMYLRRKK